MQANLIAYNQVREYEDSEENAELMKAIIGRPGQI